MLRSVVVLLAGCTGVGTCPRVDDGVAQGEVDEGSLVEASGLVASRAHPGTWWTHNDSGDSARLFAIGDDGADLGTFHVTGATQADWEDVALVDDGGWTLLVGDIGDNDASQPDIVIWRLPEPAPLPEGGSDDTAPADGLHWTYPDGPHDAETLLVDPRTGDAFVVTKDDPPRLYRAPAPLVDGAALVDEGVVDLGHDGGKKVTGGDVSADGTRIVLRSDAHAWIWARGDGTVADALHAAPCPAETADEAQGEAIAWTPDGGAYVTVGEGEHPTVWRFGVR